MRFLAVVVAASTVACGSTASTPQQAPGNSPAGAASGGQGAQSSAGDAALPGGAAGSEAAGGRAGSSSTGGAAVAGGAGQAAGGAHQVMACPEGDGAPGQVGIWENITPAAVLAKEGTPGGAILVDPQDPRVVYAGSANEAGLFKSTDCGATFTHINTGQNAADIDSGRIWDMVIDPVDTQVLYVIEGYGHGGLWKTTNGGVDWVNTTPLGSEVANTANNNFTSIVGMDVTDPQHLILAFHSGCSGAYAPSCLAETKDGGDTWRMLKVPVDGEGVGIIVLGEKNWLATGGYNALWQTTDAGETWQQVASTTAHWQLYRSPSGGFYLGSMQGILHSPDGMGWGLVSGFEQQVQGITGDGSHIFAGQQWGTKTFQIPENDATKMMELSPTDGDNDGPYFMSYDADHHIAYASEFQSGHWRMVTE